MLLSKLKKSDIRARIEFEGEEILVFEPSKIEKEEILNIVRELTSTELIKENEEVLGKHMFVKMLPILTDLDIDCTDEDLFEMIENPSIALSKLVLEVTQVFTEVLSEWEAMSKVVNNLPEQVVKKMENDAKLIERERKKQELLKELKALEDSE